MINIKEYIIIYYVCNSYIFFLSQLYSENHKMTHIKITFNDLWKNLFGLLLILLTESVRNHNTWKKIFLIWLQKKSFTFPNCFF